jgi:methylated-DNA-[protein]-cysteine S-methyltransferase
MIGGATMHASKTPTTGQRGDAIFYTVMKSPVGPLLLLSDGAHLTGLYMSEYRYGPSGGSGLDVWGIQSDHRDGEHWSERDEAEPFPETRRQLAAYFEGRLTEFDLPLSMEGSDFQRNVWNLLTEIPYGTTTTYGELAKRLGNPNGSRAVGSANGHNPISIIVPCHRVIGSNGKLTGYGGGLPRKAALLDFEFAVRLSGPHGFPANWAGYQE